MKKYIRYITCSISILVLISGCSNRSVSDGNGILILDYGEYDIPGIGQKLVVSEGTKAIPDVRPPVRVSTVHFELKDDKNAILISDDLGGPNTRWSIYWSKNGNLWAHGDNGAWHWICDKGIYEKRSLEFRFKVELKDVPKTFVNTLPGQ